MGLFHDYLHGASVHLLICSIQVSMNSFTFARDNKGRTWFALPASLSSERKLYLFLGSV